jgi:nucleoid DNA-binding protein
LYHTRFIGNLSITKKENHMAGIADVAKVSGVKEAQVKAVLEAIGAMAATENVVCRGFGTFKTAQRAGRIGRNPQTGESITIAAKSALTFKPTK